MIIHIDVRGFCLVLNPDGTYSAGCRKNWTKQRCIEHWSDPEYSDAKIAEGFLAAIERGEEITEIREDLNTLLLQSVTTFSNGIMLPENLQYLALEGNFTLPIEITLPKSLKGLALYTNAALSEGTVLPEGLSSLFLYGNSTLPKGILLPDGLLGLYHYSKKPLPEGIILPAGTRVF